MNLHSVIRSMNLHNEIRSRNLDNEIRSTNPDGEIRRMNMNDGMRRMNMNVGMERVNLDSDHRYSRSTDGRETCEGGSIDSQESTQQHIHESNVKENSFINATEYRNVLTILDEKLTVDEVDDLICWTEFGCVKTNSEHLL